MKYKGTARRDRLIFSARAFAVVSVIALAVALAGWVQFHNSTITGFHVFVAGWTGWQAHIDAVMAARTGEH